jgi:hypothetical protein
MERPAFLRAELPTPFDPLFDWLPVVLQVVKQIGHEMADVQTQGSQMTIRTGPSRMFVPSIIDACRTPDGFAVRWLHSDVKRPGLKRIFGYGEDLARFCVVFGEGYRAKFRSISREEWEPLWSASKGQSPATG